MKIKILLSMLILALALLFPLGAAAAKKEEPHIPTVPEVAMQMAVEMNRQLNGPVDENDPEAGYGDISMVVTTPVNLNSLDETSPLGRQLAEEMAYQFTNLGYSVQELRKGSGLTITPEGEFLLTRDTSKLASRKANSAAVLVGTYTLTPRSVRVNMKLLHTPSNEVLAMSSKTIPLSRELRMLASSMAMEKWGKTPSVGTRFN